MSEVRKCPNCWRETLELLDGLDEMCGMMYMNWNCLACGYFELVSESGHAYTYADGVLVPVHVEDSSCKIDDTESSDAKG